MNILQAIIYNYMYRIRKRLFILIPQINISVTSYDGNDDSIHERTQSNCNRIDQKSLARKGKPQNSLTPAHLQKERLKLWQEG